MSNKGTKGLRVLKVCSFRPVFFEQVWKVLRCAGHYCIRGRRNTRVSVPDRIIRVFRFHASGSAKLTRRSITDAEKGWSFVCHVPVPWLSSGTEAFTFCLELSVLVCLPVRLHSYFELRSGQRVTFCTGRIINQGDKRDELDGEKSLRSRSVALIFVSKGGNCFVFVSYREALIDCVHRKFTCREGRGERDALLRQAQ